MGDALVYYKYASDFGSVVRLFCQNDDIPSALKTALESSDPQACFHLARHYEQNGNLKEAIVYYSKAQRLHHAIRLAREQGFDQEVMSMSLQSSKQIMIQSAQYFERKGKFEKAAQLYIKGGNKKKGTELAIKHKLPDMAGIISTDIDESEDPEVLKQSLGFFLQNQQYEKAVQIMIHLKQLDEALQTIE